MLNAAALAELRAVLGTKGLTTESSDIAPWTTDWRKIYEGKAAALVQPGCVAEVQAVLEIASRHHIPVVPQGGNTSMVGGATPDDSGEAIIVSLRRMNAIRQLDPAAGLVVAEAGVVLSNLHDAARAVPPGRTEPRVAAQQHRGQRVIVAEMQVPVVGADQCQRRCRQFQ